MSERPVSARTVIVAIDGPAGAGKSTAAVRLANRLGFVLLDTGALYRAVALAAQERGVDWTDGPALGRLARGLELRFVPAPDGGRPRLLLAGVDRSEDIRTPPISQGASLVSAHPEVREALLAVQRRVAGEASVVAEGRDIGTVVFPRADVKVFLTATVEARTDRRYRELRDRGHRPRREEVRAEIDERDLRDTQRPVSPLRPADDAVQLDTTEADLEQVVESLVDLVRRRTGRD
ncbi:MAG: (d)CMP kinase [Sandaracinaceae bacterium]